MAGPLDLRGRVVIVDAGATRTLRGIGGAMQAVANQARAAGTFVGNAGRSFQSAGNRLTGRVGGTGMGAIAAPAAGVAFLRNEMEYQEAMNRTQAVLNMTDQKAFKPHRDLVVDLAARYPATSAEIAKGASELAMAGMTMKQVNEVLEATVQGSMASGESIKTVGMGVTDVIMGLGKALTKQNFELLNNVMSAAATSYAQDYTQFLAGYAKTAPLARMVGMDVKRLAGFLGILADAGFKAEKGGTALRTSMINAAVLTPKAAAQFKKYGVDLTKFQQKVDTFQLGGSKGAKSLSSFIGDELGVDTAGLSDVLTPLLSDNKLLGNVNQLKRRLTHTLVGGLGLGNDPENAKKIAESVERWVQSGFQQLDFEKLMRHMAEKKVDSDLVFMDAVFKKRFAAPMASIMQSMRDGTFDTKLDMFLPRIAGAVERFAGILMQGLPGAVRRLAGAFDALLRTMASSGAMDTIVGALDSLRNGINWLSTVSPGTLKALTLGLMGLAVAAPIGLAIAGIGAGLAALAAGASRIVRVVTWLGALAGALWRLKAAATAVGGILGPAAVGAPIMGAGAAAAGAAGAVGAAKAGSKLGLRLIPGIGLVLTAWGAYEGYQAYQKTGKVSDGVRGFFGMGPAQASEAPPSGISPIGDALAGPGGGQGGSGIITEAQSAMAQMRAALQVDLTAEGMRAMETFAAGIRAGGAQAVAAARDIASQVRSAAGSTVPLNTGPNMQPAR